MAWNAIKPNEIVGRRFGRLVVLGEVERVGQITRWLCQCDCGAQTTVRAAKLRNGHTRSCGCLSAEKARNRLISHGDTGSAEHSIWKAMIRRCENPKVREFHRYGGRGIRVCERWRSSFAAFLTDMGRRPSSEHSIERASNDGDYSPSNCRWATRIEQANNTRRNRNAVLDGVTRTVAEWARILGWRRGTISYRLLHGWTDRESLTIPPGAKR